MLTKIYSDETKLEALRLLDSGLSADAVAKKLKLNKNSLYAWATTKGRAKLAAGRKEAAKDATEAIKAMAEIAPKRGPGRPPKTNGGSISSPDFIRGWNSALEAAQRVADAAGPVRDLRPVFELLRRPM